MHNEIKKNATAKEVNSQISRLAGELEAEELFLQQQMKIIADKKKLQKSLKKKANKLNKPLEPQVSEHFLYRYCERVLKVDFEAIKKEVLSEDILNLIEKLGNSGQYPHKNGYSIIFKDKVATTCITQNDSK